MKKLNKGKAFAVAQLFILELNDKEMYPAKYYKDVIYYLFDVLHGNKTLEDKDVPESIHYSRIVKEAYERIEEILSKIPYNIIEDHLRRRKEEVEDFMKHGM